jgi:hypothetical protein
MFLRREHLLQEVELRARRRARVLQGEAFMGSKQAERRRRVRQDIGEISLFLPTLLEVVTRTVRLWQREGKLRRIT